MLFTGSFSSLFNQQQCDYWQNGVCVGIAKLETAEKIFSCVNSSPDACLIYASMGRLLHGDLDERDNLALRELSLCFPVSASCNFKNLLYEDFIYYRQKFKEQNKRVDESPVVSDHTSPTSFEEASDMTEFKVLLATHVLEPETQLVKSGRHDGYEAFTHGDCSLLRTFAPRTFVLAIRDEEVHPSSLKLCHMVWRFARTANCDLDLDFVLKAFQGLENGRVADAVYPKADVDLIPLMKMRGWNDFDRPISKMLVKYGLYGSQGAEVGIKLSRILNSTPNTDEGYEQYLREVLKPFMFKDRFSRSGYGEETVGPGTRRDRAVVKIEALDRLTKGRWFNSVLDFGCGDAEMLIQLKAKYNLYSSQCVGIDRNDCARSSEFKFYLGGFAQMQRVEKNSIDLVILNNVLHHLVDPMVVVNLCNYVLSDGGCLAVYDHDIRDDEAMCKMHFKHWFYARILRMKQIDMGHIAYRSKVDWAAAIDKQGFKRLAIQNGGNLGAGNFLMCFTSKIRRDGYKNGESAVSRRQDIKELAVYYQKGLVDEGDGKEEKHYCENKVKWLDVRYNDYEDGQKELKDFGNFQASLKWYFDDS
jgi:SAM-dependent methyltransferase